MASFPQRTSVANAVTHHSSFDLSCSHVTTADFMELSVAKSMELVPQQKININMTSFARLDPMILPTYGKVRMNNRAFFVPYRTIFPAWNDFINDTPHSWENGSVSIPQAVPQFKNSDFVNAFISSETDGYNTSAYVDFNSETRDANDFPNRDIVVVPVSNANNPEPYGINFTKKGKLLFKLLNQLGYKIDFNRRNNEFYHSALPLLALLRVYADYYYPSQYAQSEQLHRAMRWFTWNSPWSTSINHLRVREMFKMIESVCYDSDYFTSAWDNPSSPNEGAYSVYDVVEPTNSSIIVTNDDAGGSPYVSIGSTGGFTQFIVNSLRSFTDYLKRHQIAGARSLDRYLSRWGITLKDEKLNRCVHIGSVNQPLRIGDVTSSSSTEGATLGAYSGKGIFDGESSFSFSTDEYGMLIIVSTIVPQTQYYQGQDRNTMHLSRLDFFTPEFDNLGTQALATREVFCPHNSAEQYPNQVVDLNTHYDYNSLIFGFVPRYAEYKVGRDNVTGDLTLGSLNTGKEAWTLFRDVRPYFNENGLDTTHGLSFIIGSDSNQYNRIFNVFDGPEDHFYILHIMDIETTFPGKKLFDSYEFYEEDKANKSTVDTGGVKCN